MKAYALRIDGEEESARQALGAVVCAEVRSTTGRRLFEKGHVIAEADLPALRSLEGVQLSLLKLEEGDLHESEAAVRLGRAAAGTGVEVRGPTGARARLVARHTGLLKVNVETLRLMNSSQTVSIYTLFDGRPVKGGTIVAEAKVTPLAVPSSDVERAESYARTPPITVVPFKAVRAAALLRERLDPRQARKVADALSRKLGWFGASLDAVRYASTGSSPETLGQTMRELIESGAELLLVSGGSASDPADPLLNALPHISARLERVGIPAHPGSTLWLAYAGEVPVVGVPSCGSFSETTAFDLVLPLLLAGERPAGDALAALGHGGLLGRGDPRFPGYSDQQSQEQAPNRET